MADLDATTLAVVSGTLDSAIREMTITMRRAAMSPVLAVGNDFSNVIFDGEPRMVMQGQDQPVHLGALIFACKEVARYFGDDLAPGDVIYHNDPRTGGSHLQDMTVYKPIFIEDELLFWTVNRAHMNETGGPVAGGYNPLAEEIWAEGLRISPIKIYDGGRPRRDVIDLLLTNFRTRAQFTGDLGAQVSACTLAEKRLTRLVGRYGSQVVKACLGSLIDRAERLMRHEIASMPNGEFRGESIVEDDARGSGDLRITCSLRISGDEMSIRIDSPPQVRSYLNSYAANTLSAVYLGVITYVDPNLPHNEGLYRPLKVDLGETGTVTNAREPAACGLSTNTPFENITDAVRNALAGALPEHAGGGWAHACVNSLFGVDPRYQEPYAFYLHASGWGGGGASFGRDGDPCIGSIGAAAAAMTGDIEILEHAAPIHIHRYELQPDSGCPGRYRGGLGNVFEFTVLGHDALMTQFGDGMKYPAPSVLGADSQFNAERVHRKYVFAADGETSEKLPLHCVRTLRSGERVLIFCAGGGGVGDPFARDPEAVLSDVRDGFVSPARARDEYGVAVVPDSFELDQTATAALRAANASDRGPGA
jgi:N-methylhydantoinase B